jgi:hypothetical protein
MVKKMVLIISQPILNRFGQSLICQKPQKQGNQNSFFLNRFGTVFIGLGSVWENPGPNPTIRFSVWGKMAQTRPNRTSPSLEEITETGK